MAKNKDAGKKPVATDESKVECFACGEEYHRIDLHLEKAHKGDWTLESYKKAWPNAEIYSAKAKARLAATGDNPVVEAPPAKKAPKDQLRFGVATLNVRDKEKLSAHEAALVPVHDEGYNVGEPEVELWEDMALAVNCRDNVFIYGPTGSGKTTSILELAAMINQPCYRLNCSGEIRVADFVGDKTVEIDPATSQNYIRWQDGILPMCMRNGWWLILDELDAAPPHVLFALQGVLERGGRLVLTQNEGEIVPPHKMFRVFATANTNGRGDESGSYSGTQLLNEAFLDRFAVVLHRDYPDTETEAAILVARGVTTIEASKMVEVANKVREANKADAVACTFSTRRLIAWADKTVRYGSAKRAAKVTILNRLSQEEGVFVSGIIQRCM